MKSSKIKKLSFKTRKKKHLKQKNKGKEKKTRIKKKKSFKTKSRKKRGGVGEDKSCCKENEIVVLKGHGAMIAKSVEDTTGGIIQRKLNLFQVPPNTYIMTVSVPGKSAPFNEEFDKTIKNALRDYELFENNYKSIKKTEVGERFEKMLQNTNWGGKRRLYPELKLRNHLPAQKMNNSIISLHGGEPPCSIQSCSIDCVGMSKSKDGRQNCIPEADSDGIGGIIKGKENYFLLSDFVNVQGPGIYLIIICRNYVMPDESFYIGEAGKDAVSVNEQLSPELMKKEFGRISRQVSETAGATSDELFEQSQRVSENYYLIKKALEMDANAYLLSRKIAKPAIPIGSLVEIKDIESQPELNGRKAIVKGYIPKNERYEVELKPLLLKKENLEIIAGASALTTTEIIPDGTEIKIVGVSNPLLNGIKGLVTGYTSAKERYSVTFIPLTRKIKLKNLTFIKSTKPYDPEAPSRDMPSFGEKLKTATTREDFNKIIPYALTVVEKLGSPVSGMDEIQFLYEISQLIAKQ